MLELYRDDGPLAAALGAALGRPAARPADRAAVRRRRCPALVAIVVKGDGASRGARRRRDRVGRAASAGSRAAARSTDRLRWAVPPRCASIEYAGCSGSPPSPAPTRCPAAFALLCAITYHHYDVVYGLRHRGVPPPRWVQAAGGRLGRAAAARRSCCCSPARCRPASTCWRSLSRSLFVGETVAEWRRIGRAEQPVYDDEEDEDD